MFNKSRKKQNIKQYCSGDTSKKYEQERKRTKYKYTYIAFEEQTM